MKLTQCGLCGVEYIEITSAQKDHLCKFVPQGEHPMDTIKRLTAELAEAKEREDVNATRIHLFDEENDALRCRAEAAERELARMRQSINDTESALGISGIYANLESRLARYAGGVEVEGVIRLYDDEVHIENNLEDWPVGHGIDVGQSVTVLVMKG